MSNDFKDSRPPTLVDSDFRALGRGKDHRYAVYERRGMPIQLVVTATTRPRRTNEVKWQDYFFVSKEEFRAHDRRR